MSKDLIKDMATFPSNWSQLVGKAETWQWGAKIKKFSMDESGESVRAKVVVLGVDKTVANLFRNSFFTMAAIEGIALYDGGDLNDGGICAVETCQFLLNKGFFPLLIGAGDEAAISLVKSYERTPVLPSYVYVDSKVEANITGGTPLFLNKLIGNKSKQLGHLTVLGYQSYLVNPAALHWLDEQNLDYMRLGAARAGLEDTEPILRFADILHFNIRSIRSSEAPATSNESPAGFFLEDACRIFRYAGLSENLSSVVVSGLLPEHSGAVISANGLSQMIWYLLEGVANRKNEIVPKASDCTKFTVPSSIGNKPIAFWKSNKTERWWMALPSLEEGGKAMLVPCSYEDYKLASSGDLSDRLMKAVNRYYK